HCFHVFSFHYFLLHRALHSFPTRRSSDLFTQVQDTDDYRLAAARSMLASLQNQYGYYIVIGEPKIVSMPHARAAVFEVNLTGPQDRKSTRLNSSHVAISYAVFCLKKKTKT